MKCFVSVYQKTPSQPTPFALLHGRRLRGRGATLTVRDEAAEIAADDAVPGWAFSLVKLFR